MPRKDVGISGVVKNLNLKLAVNQSKMIQEAMCYPNWWEQADGFESAKSIAKTNDEIVLLYFSAGYCVGCKRVWDDIFKTCTFGQWFWHNSLELAKIELGKSAATDKTAEFKIAVNYGYDAEAVGDPRHGVPIHRIYMPVVFALDGDGKKLGRIECSHIGDVSEFINNFNMLAGTKWP